MSSADNSFLSGFISFSFGLLFVQPAAIKHIADNKTNILLFIDLIHYEIVDSLSFFTCKNKRFREYAKSSCSQFFSETSNVFFRNEMT